MKVVIIGAGIGGLICAISCRREGLDVTVLERAPALEPVGAGIQIPPNAARVARSLGILPELMKRAVVLDSIEYLRYANGQLLYEIAGASKIRESYGDLWMVIARPDYHEVLWNAAKELGVELRLNAEAEKIDFDLPSVQLVGGEVIRGDVIVGADGLWSRCRDQILGRNSPPLETGDLAYRATLTLEEVQALNDPQINAMIQANSAKCWMGPDKHCVFYPIKGGKEFNLVLLKPDDLSKDVRQAPGDVEEMRAMFKGWDDRLTKLLSRIPRVLKWKLCYHEELESWVLGPVALLGDSCHPTLPYQAQGAAMAAEDGAVLGKLLGQLHRSRPAVPKMKAAITDVLKVYEKLRKSRTTVNVRGAMSNQQAYHLHDGPLQQNRDLWLQSSEAGNSGTLMAFADKEYLQEILKFDVIEESVAAFRDWEQTSAPLSTKI